MKLSSQALWRFAQLYRDELNADVDDDIVGALPERRAPMLLRLAMLMALTDLQTRIDAPHINAAMAWIRHATKSVRFAFVSADEEARMAQVVKLSIRVLTFLRERGQATRSQISAEMLPRQGVQSLARRQPRASAGSHTAQDQRAMGRAGRRDARHTDTGISARLGRLISLASPRQIAGSCLSNF